jgi:hypothetical protein
VLDTTIREYDWNVGGMTSIGIRKYPIFTSPIRVSNFVQTAAVNGVRLRNDMEMSIQGIP